MRISESCAQCLYDRQREQTDDPAYLAEIRKLLDSRKETDTSPYMAFLFNKVHKRYFGRPADYSAIKKQCNDLVLSMESGLRREIENSPDPLQKALVMARTGNYIDFGAMDHLDEEEFLSLFHDMEMSPEDEKTYQSFLTACAEGRRFLLICDNSGEIVLDKLLIEQIRSRFPNLLIQILVRGREVLNDATVEDAVYTGLDLEAEIISNGEAVAGTIYGMLPQEAKTVFDLADVVLAKGQGNYESLSGQGHHVFYLFLCKCELFMTKFQVPRLTGIFAEEF